LLNRGVADARRRDTPAGGFKRVKTFYFFETLRWNNHTESHWVTYREKDFCCFTNTTTYLLGKDIGGRDDSDTQTRMDGRRGTTSRDCMDCLLVRAWVYVSRPRGFDQFALALLGGCGRFTKVMTIGRAISRTLV
jgi:hypothetical protein